MTRSYSVTASNNNTNTVNPGTCRVRLVGCCRLSELSHCCWKWDSWIKTVMVLHCPVCCRWAWSSTCCCPCRAQWTPEARTDCGTPEHREHLYYSVNRNRPHFINNIIGSTSAPFNDTNLLRKLKLKRKSGTLSAVKVCLCCWGAHITVPLCNNTPCICWMAAWAACMHKQMEVCITTLFRVNIQAAVMGKKLQTKLIQVL